MTDPRAALPPERRVAWLVRMIYPVRSLGLVFALVVIAATLHDRRPEPLAWIPVVFHTLLWPTLAYWRCRRAADQRATEMQNLLVDSFFIGGFLSLLSFSLLPSLFLIAGTHFPNLAVGGLRLEARGIAATVAGALAAALWLGLHFQPEANLIASLASTLCTLIFIAVVGLNAFRISRHYIEARQSAEQRAHDLEQARAAAESASRAKSQFLANMSHELRTPMNAIIGFNDLLRRGDNDPRRQEQMRHIDSASRSLLALINQILDLSKIEAGRLELEQSAFALQPLLDQLAALFQSQAAGKGLQLRIVRDGRLPPAVRGDPLRLEQVLMNLLGNALKFTASGTIELSVASRDGSSVAFAIKDSGIGISEEQLGRLFTPFSQADASTTRRFGGTGLGLVISKQLIELMGGKLDVQSRPGIGSEFRFTLPLPPASAAELPTELPAPVALRELPAATDLRGRRVLLAEDNDLNCRLAGAILREAGIQLDIAHDGGEALRAVQMQPYDAVLMDMQMPEMDGLEATRRIRRLPGHAALPIIAMTANAMEQDREACLAAGMNDFLPKPIDASHMLAMLARWTSMSGAPS